MVPDKMPTISIIYQWLDNSHSKLSPASYNKYEQLIRIYIKPFFLNIDSASISGDTLKQFHQYITFFDSENAAHLSIGNKRTIFMILNSSLEFAYSKQYLLEPLYLKPSLKKEKHIVRTFSIQNQKDMEHYIFANESLFSLAILIALYSGLRIGELCALKWADVNFENSSLRVEHTAQRIKTSDKEEGAVTKLVILPPKSSTSYRMIPIPDFVINYMKKFYADDKNDSYIFSEDKEKPLDPRTLQYAYKVLLGNADVPYLNFHCLRHTFATRCVMLGWDMKTLSEVLGHADIKITMEYYFHSSFEHKKNQMNKLVRL